MKFHILSGNWGNLFYSCKSNVKNWVISHVDKTKSEGIKHVHFTHGKQSTTLVTKVSKPKPISRNDAQHPHRQHVQVRTQLFNSTSKLSTNLVF